jgi:hypothetical protein
MIKITINSFAYPAFAYGFTSPVCPVWKVKRGETLKNFVGLFIGRFQIK